jgi:hypothetical protein
MRYPSISATIPNSRRTPIVASTSVLIAVVVIVVVGMVVVIVIVVDVVFDDPLVNTMSNSAKSNRVI